jgi:hypothetical protein
MNYRLMNSLPLFLRGLWDAQQPPVAQNLCEVRSKSPVSDLCALSALG